jgi:hypothetical protein
VPSPVPLLQTASLTVVEGSPKTSFDTHDTCSKCVTACVTWPSHSPTRRTRRAPCRPRRWCRRTFLSRVACSPCLRKEERTGCPRSQDQWLPTDGGEFAQALGPRKSCPPLPKNARVSRSSRIWAPNLLHLLQAVKKNLRIAQLRIAPNIVSTRFGYAGPRQRHKTDKTSPIGTCRVLSCRSWRALPASSIRLGGHAGVLLHPALVRVERCHPIRDLRRFRAEILMKHLAVVIDDEGHDA